MSLDTLQWVVANWAILSVVGNVLLVVALLLAVRFGLVNKEAVTSVCEIIQIFRKGTDPTIIPSGTDAEVASRGAEALKRTLQGNLNEDRSEIVAVVANAAKAAKGEPGESKAKRFGRFLKEATIGLIKRRIGLPG